MEWVGHSGGEDSERQSRWHSQWDRQKVVPRSNAFGAKES